MNVLDAIAASMSVDVSRMTSLGQNLVNASTPAYKREVSRAQGFASLVDSQGGVGSFVTGGPAVDMRSGTLRHTGQVFDIAVETANTFLEVQTPHGAAYTRRGDMRIDEQGRLCDHAGHPVMGTTGVLVVPPGPARIASDGTLTVGEERVGRLRLVRFAEASALQRTSGSLFLAAGLSGQDADDATVRQQHLEASNVDTASEMVSLVETMRHFESSQKLMQGIDDMNERALRKLGEF